MTCTNLATIQFAIFDYLGNVVESRNEDGELMNIDSGASIFLSILKDEGVSHIYVAVVRSQSRGGGWTYSGFGMHGRGRA